MLQAVLNKCGWRSTLLAGLENARIAGHQISLDSFRIIEGRLEAIEAYELDDEDDYIDPFDLVDFGAVDEASDAESDDDAEDAGNDKNGEDGENAEDKPDGIHALNVFLEETAKHCCLCGKSPMPESRGKLPICQEFDTKFDFGLPHILDDKPAHTQ